MRSARHRASHQLYTVLFGTVAAALVVILIIKVSLRLADVLRPQEGDVIAFAPANVDVMTRAQIVATRVGQSPATFCMLDPRVMQRFGGSLVIEAVEGGGGRRYRVHWAGGRTSVSGADCGGSANLLLTPDDIAILLLATNSPSYGTNEPYSKPGISRRAR